MESLKERLVVIGAKNDLLESQKGHLGQALSQLGVEVRQGQHKYGAGGDGSSSSASSSSSSASQAQPPDFEKIVGDLYRERAGDQTADAHEQFLRDGKDCNDIRATLAMEDAGGDDEIEQVRTENDLKQEVFCPLTQDIMTDPLTCKECNHSFEGKAIISMLKNKNTGISCPVAGCSVKVTKAKLVKNPRLEKKIVRYHKQQAQSSQYSQMDAEDIEDDEEVYMAD
uniref:SP-RING-type domain-containing protein n=1 Tax=Florenciella parvula TaxID=236787 RepID=A0A7S2BI37_9STRA|mmetsp:Transcript_17085/g.35714  ORF Transcript_17085/g.35714 Transcript_17085/m.35714 type:complete len:226 (+) Transcript_17085:3-680(+)